jgi:hypothetical protein
MIPSYESGSNEISGSLATFSGYFGAQGFINKSNTVALFIQIGFGFNSGTITTKMGDNESDNGLNILNLGGSAFGGSIYF